MVSRPLASHKTYDAELKLMAMGGERVYTKIKTGNQNHIPNVLPDSNFIASKHSPRTL